MVAGDLSPNHASSKEATMQYIETAMRQIGMSQEEIERVRIRAERARRRDEAPDGALQYVPHTTEYAVRDLVGRRTMRLLTTGDE